MEQNQNEEQASHEPHEEQTQRGQRKPGRRPLAEGSADDTRRLIRQHALRLFNERGYASVSVDDIAQAAGLTRATLYYHYKGKADIFVESVELTMVVAHSEVAKVVHQEGVSVAERLRQLIEGRRMADTLTEDDLEAGFVPEFMVDEALPYLTARQQARVQATFQAFHAMTRDLMTEGIASGEFRPLPPAVFDYAFWILFQPAQYRQDVNPDSNGLSREEMENGLMALFLHGAASG